MNLLRKCVSCGRYSLSAVCVCNSGTTTPHPPKFSLMRKYARYRKSAR
ncbi:MAG: ribosome biogenesis protein [Candidatus Aenigmarchaeota archaeon]|nr:ribosome biogenesis protein [Candidatus Aenigmarchaeota archaeon]